MDVFGLKKVVFDNFSKLRSLKQVL